MFSGCGHLQHFGVSQNERENFQTDIIDQCIPFSHQTLNKNYLLVFSLSLSILKDIKVKKLVLAGIEMISPLRLE